MAPLLFDGALLTPRRPKEILHLPD